METENALKRHWKPTPSSLHSALDGNSAKTGSWYWNPKLMTFAWSKKRTKGGSDRYTLAFKQGKITFESNKQIRQSHRHQDFSTHKFDMFRKLQNDVMCGISPAGQASKLRQHPQYLLLFQQLLVITQSSTGVLMDCRMSMHPNSGRLWRQAIASFELCFCSFFEETTLKLCFC